MSRDWESVFSTWSHGPSKTEHERAENAENQIRQAILASDKLKNRSIHVFTQGSYRNRVNVRKDCMSSNESGPKLALSENRATQEKNV